MLTHYTANIESAISILNSGVFRMSRSSEVKTDDNEINHALDIINNINELNEIQYKNFLAKTRLDLLKIDKKNPLFEENLKDIYILKHCVF